MWHFLETFDDPRGRRGKRQFVLDGRTIRAGDLLELRFPRGQVAPVTWFGDRHVQLRLGGAWEDDNAPAHPAGHRMPLATVVLPAGAQLRWPAPADATRQAEARVSEVAHG